MEEMMQMPHGRLYSGIAGYAPDSGRCRSGRELQSM